MQESPSWLSRFACSWQVFYDLLTWVSERPLHKARPIENWQYHLLTAQKKHNVLGPSLNHWWYSMKNSIDLLVICLNFAKKCASNFSQTVSPIKLKIKLKIYLTMNSCACVADTVISQWSEVEGWIGFKLVFWYFEPISMLEKVMNQKNMLKIMRQFF